MLFAGWRSLSFSPTSEAPTLPMTRPHLGSPQYSLKVGASLSAGRGISTTTFCRSNSSVASYSMFTYVSPPDTDGQQLTGRHASGRAGRQESEKMVR